MTGHMQGLTVKIDMVNILGDSHIVKYAGLYHIRHLTSLENIDGVCMTHTAQASPTLIRRKSSIKRNGLILSYGFVRSFGNGGIIDEVNR
jgi:hypothetical protein